jgi:hypothetical protein
MLTSVIILRVKLLFISEVVANLVIPVPLEHCLFVDHEALNDRITSSDRTSHHDSFRDDIIKRDGACLITQTPADNCDAVHLVPRSKGDEVSLRQSMCSLDDIIF